VDDLDYGPIGDLGKSLESMRSIRLVDRIRELANQNVTGGKIALSNDRGLAMSYSLVFDKLEEFRISSFVQANELVILILSREIDSVLAYLGVLNSGASLIIAPEDMSPNAVIELRAAYRPNAILGSASEIKRLGMVPTKNWGEIGRVEIKEGLKAPTIQQQVLMSTSGSSGSPKQVRLTEGHLAANARDIATALGIVSDDVALTQLPLSYSYGLSVLNSHLWAGAHVVCSSIGVVSSGFVQFLEAQNLSSLVGVPFTYQMYTKIGIYERLPKSVRYFTQAGGAMKPEVVSEVATALQKSSVEFFSMYGQTEATARIAILHSSLALDYPDSVGIPVQSGSVEIGTENHSDEMVFYGPNTMLGYSLNRDDLSDPDTCLGHLETGDLAEIRNGLIFIKGRIKRIAKINGLRVNLAEIEQSLSKYAPTAVVEKSNQLLVVSEAPQEQFSELGDFLKGLGFQDRDFKLTRVDELPKLHSGKIDLAALSEG
jgi:acyl-coenzyme A synthetase/AMP-(fatty) acid ligase